MKIKKLNLEAVIPNYAHDGDAGMDLYSIEEKTLQPNERHLFKTGISIELEKGLFFNIRDKSGLAIKHGLTTLGGVVDSTYRGEIAVILLNTSNKEYAIKKGDKIAQAIIQKVEHPFIEEVEHLNDSDRSDGGFGSTGR